MTDRKELVRQYKQMKPDMGVFSFRCMSSGKEYVGFGQNVKADINSLTFQLNFGSFNANKNLQKDWNEFGSSNFEITVLELLKYDEDETKTDYKDDLRVLRELCVERLDDWEYIQ